MRHKKGASKVACHRLTWAELRSKVAKINSDLTGILDRINPPSNFYLYVVSYRYGDLIMKNGLFHLPLQNGELVPLRDDRVPKSIYNDLSYAEGRTPAALVLEKSVELFIDTENHILPWRLLKPGEFFAAFTSLEASPLFYPATVFSLTAGARNAFMLPKVSDKLFHKSMCHRLNVKTPVPKNLLNQWETFKAILSSPKVESNWAASIVLFPKKWVEHIRNNPAWRDLYVHIMRAEWKKTTYLRNKIFYDFALSQAQENRNLKPNPYLLDTAKHLFAIASGSVAGFKPANNDLMLPEKTIRHAYEMDYKVKYCPTIMQPDYLSIEKADSIFYSLQLPTTLEFSPKSRKISSTISNLIELRHIVNVFCSEILTGNLHVKKTILEKIAQDVSFDFYHTHPDQHGEIEPSENLEFPVYRLADPENPSPFNRLAFSGTFLRGCACINNYMKPKSTEK